MALYQGVLTGNREQYGYGVGTSLKVSSSTFSSDTALGAKIASVTNPFGAGTTYSVVGSTPVQLSLNTSTGVISKASGVALGGNTYSIKIRATSANGKQEVADTFTFAVYDNAGSAPPGYEFLTGFDGQLLVGEDGQALYGIAA